MADDKIGPIGFVAPDWIAFTDLPKWIQRRFARRLSERSMQDLFSIIRRDTRHDPFRIPDPRIVRHRVGGLSARDVRTKDYSTILDPRGLRFDGGSPCNVAVAKWDDAKFDPETFTVEGLYSFSARQRTRHPIEVCWVDVERWFQRQIDLSGSARDWGSASVHIDVSSILRSASSRVIDDQPGPAAAEQPLAVAKAQPQRRKSVDRVKIVDWMKSHAKGQLLVREKTVSAAMGELKCTREAAREAWKDVPAELRQTRGRPPGKIGRAKSA